MNPNDIDREGWVWEGLTNSVKQHQEGEVFTVEFPVEKLSVVEGVVSVYLNREEAERLRDSITACLEESR